MQVTSSRDCSLFCADRIGSAIVSPKCRMRGGVGGPFAVDQDFAAVSEVT
jgi:hypothetical protein